jgi:hypothetical protein
LIEDKDYSARVKWWFEAEKERIGGLLEERKRERGLQNPLEFYEPCSPLDISGYWLANVASRHNRIT